MKSKGKLLSIILIIVSLIICLIFFVKDKKFKEINNEYEPEEEISEEQERQTMISLYFFNKDTKEVEPEARIIDVKELYSKPYITIFNKLMEGPKEDKHKNIIPEETKLLQAKLSDDTLVLNFSLEFINNYNFGEENELKLIQCLVKTYTELNEVNSIKILVNGEENAKFKDGDLVFSKEFTRED